MHDGTGVTDLLAEAMSIIQAAQHLDLQHSTQLRGQQLMSCSQHLAAQRSTVRARPVPTQALLFVWLSLQTRRGYQFFSGIPRLTR